MAGNTDINEVIDARRSFGAETTFTTLGERLNDNDEKVATTQKFPILENEMGVVDMQYPYGNILRFGAVSGGDSTEAITNALAYCNATNTPIYFPNGRYLDDLERVAKTSVKGESLFKTHWVYMQDAGTFLTFDNLYSYYHRLDNIWISHINTTNTANGAKITRCNWGGSLRGYKHRIDNFDGTLLSMVDAFNCYFDDCRYQGLTTSILVDDIAVNSISNVNRFNQCVFTTRKIAVKAFNIMDLRFKDCTFEVLNELLNAEQTTSNSHISSEGCHLEVINTHSVANAKIDLNTLAVADPIVNKVPLENIKFRITYMHSLTIQFTLTQLLTQKALVQIENITSTYQTEYL